MTTFEMSIEDMKDESRLSVKSILLMDGILVGVAVVSAVFFLILFKALGIN